MKNSQRKGVSTFATPQTKFAKEPPSQRTKKQTLNG